jgi:hypothetical protein
MKGGGEATIEFLEVRKRLFGNEHLDTLRTMINLAITFSGQNQLKESEGLELQAVFETGPTSPRAFRRALRRPGRAGNLKAHEASGFLIKSPGALSKPAGCMGFLPVSRLTS